LTGAMQAAVSVLQAVMDRRIAFRLAIIVSGMFLADDRRTASAWFVTAGVQDDWDRFYDCLASVTCQYKTFLATSRLISGEIRVVILRFEDGG
jgi:hypothetical protein